MAMAFQRMIERMLRSIYASPGLCTSFGTGIVFRYGVVMAAGCSIPRSAADSDNCFSRNVARSLPTWRTTEPRASSHSLVSRASISSCIKFSSAEHTLAHKIITTKYQELLALRQVKTGGLTRPPTSTANCFTGDKPTHGAYCVTPFGLLFPLACLLFPLDRAEKC